jgi:hypothetical protein
MHAADKVAECVEITIIIRDEIVCQSQVGELSKVTDALRCDVDNLVKLVSITSRVANLESVLTREWNVDGSSCQAGLADERLRIREAGLIGGHLQARKIEGNRVI